MVKEPKTVSSVRTLDVPAPLMQKLRKRKLECAANRMRLGRNYVDTEYIIVHEDGEPIYPEYLSQMLTKLQDRCGLPRCRFHDLRHLCASTILLQGVHVKVAQDWFVR